MGSEMCIRGSICRLTTRTGTDAYMCIFCFQAEDGIRDLVRSRGLGDVYKRQFPDTAKS